jgi:hypothetical protein
MRAGVMYEGSKYVHCGSYGMDKIDVLVLLRSAKETSYCELQTMCKSCALLALLNAS